MLVTRTAMRSDRSRSSRLSTKPLISTFHAGAASTGWAMTARLIAAVAKPAATNAIASAAGKANGRWRNRMAATTAAPVNAAAAHGAGSWLTLK
jgi:hypothetical protein